MATTIQSILENSGNGFEYRIYIFHQDITNEYQKLLQKIISKKSNFQIEFINASKYFEKYTLHTEGISVEAYYRLLIPYYFTEYEKIIYIDSDTICFSDISELYQYDLSENVIGAVQGIAEIGWYKSTLNHYWDSVIKIKDPEKYFNSGLLVFNVNQFKKNIDFESLLKLSEQEKWPCYDQDVLNIVCEDKVSFFPYEWNFIKYHTIQYVSEELQKIYFEAEKQPKIVHFATGHKPWSNPSNAPYAKDFWKYATKTPFFTKKIIDYKKYNNLAKGAIKKVVKAFRPNLRSNS